LIYPSARLFLAIAGGAALAMLIGVANPDLWLMPLVWALLLLACAGIDVISGRRHRMTGVQLQAPHSVDIGDSFAIEVQVQGGLPSHVTEAAISANSLLRLDGGGKARVGAEGAAVLQATAERRGTATISRIDVRWLGPLGLVWQQRRIDVARDIVVTPALRSLSSDGVALLSRDARAGLVAQLNTGPGGEFEALTEYEPGMDRRRIDWKQSARHQELLVKEFRVERDNNIVLAFDCGRTMVEPIWGLPRIDRAITAGLLTAYLSLKMGDRVTLFGFDSKVRQVTAPQSGPGSFAAIKRAAAQLDYSSEEANFTLALSVLAQRLTRRSLIILFTDFVDPTSAEWMLRSIGRLLSSHVLLCVVMRDEDLESLLSAPPGDADDVSRAVIAAGLLRERRIVLTRLRRMGVEVLEAPWRDLGPAVTQRYLATKRRQLL
jgi:uncharacterized protein (DUF58 family)